MLVRLSSAIRLAKPNVVPCFSSSMRHRFSSGTALVPEQRKQVLEAIGTVDMDKLCQRSELDSTLKQLRALLEERGVIIHKSHIPKPRMKDLYLWALLHGTPFVVFGFMANALMLFTGDFIDSNLGAYLGVSTMFACGIGNIVGDVSGIFTSNPVENRMVSIYKALRLPMPELTSSQKSLVVARKYKAAGCVGGIFIGCVLGLFPLLWPVEWRLWASKNTLKRSGVVYQSPSS